jgi:hypothetical protein
MAKHNIGGTSTVCAVSKHTWLPGIATNYRQCGQCRTVEVLIDGQWVPPTGRSKRVSSVVAPTPSLMQVADRDLRAKVTRLVDLPSVQPHTVSLSNGTTVYSDGRMTRRELGEKLFSWGTANEYPQFYIQVPARVYSIADREQSQIELSSRIHIISTGVAAWRAVCFQCPQAVVEAALEQVNTYKIEWPELLPAERAQRLALLECGRAREWSRFTFKATTPEMRGYHFTFIIDGGEDSWTRFIRSGRYDHVCEAMKLLEQKKEAVQ